MIPLAPVRHTESESALGNRSEAIRDGFYSENFLRIFPDARAAYPPRIAVILLLLWMASDYPGASLSSDLLRPALFCLTGR